MTEGNASPVVYYEAFQIKASVRFAEVDVRILLPQLPVARVWLWEEGFIIFQVKVTKTHVTFLFLFNLFVFLGWWIVNLILLDVQ